MFAGRCSSALWPLNRLQTPTDESRKTIKPPVVPDSPASVVPNGPVSAVTIGSIDSAARDSISVPGCERMRLRRDIQRIMESRIVLPQEVSVAQGGEVYPMPDSVRSKPKMIVYVDSTECTMCRLSKFEACYGPLYAQSKETGVFELLLLIRSGEVEGMPIARVVSDFEFGIPVYVDERNRFLKDNPSVPLSYKRLHSLFVNGEGKPILIGDPALNGRVREMFEVKLKEVKLNEDELKLFNP